MSAPTPSLSSGEVNLLIQHYLQELGYDHAAFAFACESKIPSHPIATRDVPPGALVYLVQKGMMYSRIEEVADSGMHGPSSEQSHATRKLLADLRQSEEMIQEGFDSTTWLKLLKDPESHERPLYFLDDRTSLVLAGHSRSVTVMTWSPDDRFLATGSMDGRVVVWSYDNSCKQIMDRPAVMRVGGKDVTCIGWDGGSQNLVVGTYSGKVVRYNSEFVEQWVCEETKMPIVAVEIRKDLVVGDCRGTVFVMDELGNVHDKWEIGGGLVDVMWVSDTSIAAAIDDTVYLLELQKTDPMVIHKAKSRIAQIIVDATKEFLVIGEDAGFVTIFNLNSKQIVMEQPFHAKGVCALSFCQGSTQFATGGRDGFVKMYNIENKDEIGFEGHAQTVYAVACHPKALYVATVGAEKIINVWSTETKRAVVSLVAEKDRVGVMTWSNNGQFLTIGLENGHVSLVDFSQICQ